MHKIVISGGPSTGKSTTFEALQLEYPDAHFVEEAAEQVIRLELDKQLVDPDYDPVMPVTRYMDFLPLVVSQQLKDEASIPDDAGLVLLDRSVIDNVGYLRHNNLEELIPEVHNHAKAARYAIVFFCDWLGKVEQTEIRRESTEQGLAIHRQLELAYHETDLPVIHLPAVSPEERLQIIRTNIDMLLI